MQFLTLMLAYLFGWTLVGLFYPWMVVEIMMALAQTLRAIHADNATGNG